MKVRTFDGTKKYGNEYAQYHLWASAMVWFNKTIGLVQQNQRFGSAKPKVWFNKSKGLVQQKCRSC